MSGPILKLANAATLDLDDAIKHAPHTVPSGNGDRHVRALKAIKKDVQFIVNLAGEAADIERGDGFDHEALLGELVEAVMLRGGRLDHPATADRSGVNRAMAALAEMKPILGRTPDDRGHLLEAVRAQDATCTLHLFAPARFSETARFDEKPAEEHLDYPVPPGVALVEGLVILVPSAPPMTGKRRARVVEVSADGRCAIVRAKLDPPKAARAVPAKAAN